MKGNTFGLPTRLWEKPQLLLKVVTRDKSGSSSITEKQNIEVTESKGSRNIEIKVQNHVNLLFLCKINCPLWICSSRTVNQALNLQFVKVYSSACVRKELTNLWLDSGFCIMAVHFHTTLWRWVLAKNASTSFGPSTVLTWFIHIWLFMFPKL